jgi:hypothetical protein
MPRIDPELPAFQFTNHLALLYPPSFRLRRLRSQLRFQTASLDETVHLNMSHLSKEDR